MSSNNFKQWFKNSKAVNEDGSPLIMYHGSTTDFNIFDEAKINPNETDAVYNGFWFTSEEENASPAWINPIFIKGYYLSMQNPAPIEIARRVYDEVYSLDTFPCDFKGSIIDLVRLRLQEMGYDGVIHQDKPIVNKEEYETTGKVEYKSNRGNKWSLIKNVDNGGADLYDYRNECITGYYDFDDFIELHSERVFIVFKPNQIKSTDNIGTFDNDNLDIRF